MMLSLFPDCVAAVLHPELCSMSQYSCSVASEVPCLPLLSWADLGQILEQMCSMKAAVKEMNMWVALMVQCRERERERIYFQTVI